MSRVYTSVLGVTDDDGAYRKTQLVNWYLSQLESELEGDQEMQERRVVIEKVLERLTKVVSAITSSILDLY